MKSKKIKLFCFYLLLIFLIIASSFFLAKKIIINTTNSLPGLIYLKKDHISYARSSVVLVCAGSQVSNIALKLKILTKNSLLCDDTMPLIKKIAAVPGDAIQADGIHVLKINGQNLEHSTPYTPSILPRFIAKRKLKSNEFLIFSPHPQSFDSRYFGAIKKNQIKAELKLLF